MAGEYYYYTIELSAAEVTHSAFLRDLGRQAEMKIARLECKAEADKSRARWEDAVWRGRRKPK